MKADHYDECELFVCDCSDVAHQLVFQLWDFGKDGEELWRPAKENANLTVCVYLNQYRGFWSRLWHGIKYICGYRSKYGEFDVIDIRYEDVPRMKAILDKFASRVEKYQAELAAIDANRNRTQD